MKSLLGHDAGPSNRGQAMQIQTDADVNQTYIREMHSQDQVRIQSLWLLHVCLVLVSFDIAITIARCRDHRACRGVMQCIGIAGNQQAVNC